MQLVQKFKRSAKAILTFCFYSVIFIGAWLYRDSKLQTNVDAPRIELFDINGVSHQIPANNGQTLIYFFAPWCKVCHLSMDNFSKIAQSNDYPDIDFAAIALDWGSKREVDEFLKDKLVATPILMGLDDIKESFQIKGYPTYYLINSNGVITAGSFGYSTEIGMRAFLTLHDD